MKKIFNLLLVCCIVLSFCACDTESSKYSKGLEMVETSLGWKVTGIGECTDKNIVIPEKFKGKKVVAIEGQAFADCDLVETVNLPDTVASIGVGAFCNCANLTTINIPTNLKTIETAAFTLCKKLQSITIPESVSIIKDRAFSECESLVNVTLPKTITSIGRGAFASCNSLESLVLPADIKKIDVGIIARCDNIKDFIVPECVTKVGGFNECKNLENITLPFTIKSIDDTAFYKADKLSEIHYNGTKEEWKKIKLNKEVYWDTPDQKQNANVFLEVPDEIPTDREKAYYKITPVIVHCTDGDISMYISRKL